MRFLLFGRKKIHWYRKHLGAALVDTATSPVVTKSQGWWAKTKSLIRYHKWATAVVAGAVAGGLMLRHTHKTNLRLRDYELNHNLRHRIDELNRLEEMAKQSGAGSNSGFEVEQ